MENPVAQRKRSGERPRGANGGRRRGATRETCGRPVARCDRRRRSRKVVAAAAEEPRCPGGPCAHRRSGPGRGTCDPHWRRAGGPAGATAADSRLVAVTGPRAVLPITAAPVRITGASRLGDRGHLSRSWPAVAASGRPEPRTSWHLPETPERTCPRDCRRTRAERRRRDLSPNRSTVVVLVNRLWKAQQPRAARSVVGGRRSAHHEPCNDRRLEAHEERASIDLEPASKIDGTGWAGFKLRDRSRSDTARPWRVSLVAERWLFSVHESPVHGECTPSLRTSFRGDAVAWTLPPSVSSASLFR